MNDWLIDWYLLLINFVVVNTYKNGYKSQWDTENRKDPVCAPTEVRLCFFPAINDSNVAVSLWGR